MWMDPSVTVIKRHTITGRAGVLICTLTRHFSKRWVSGRGRPNVDGSVGNGHKEAHHYWARGRTDLHLDEAFFEEVGFR